MFLCGHLHMTFQLWHILCAKDGSTPFKFSIDGRKKTATTTTTTMYVSMDLQEEKFRDQITQTDSLNESQSLKQEILALKEKIQSLETTIHELNSKPKFKLSDHKDKDHDIAFYTGFPN